MLFFAVWSYIMGRFTSSSAVFHSGFNNQFLSRWCVLEQVDELECLTNELFEPIPHSLLPTPRINISPTKVSPLLPIPNLSWLPIRLDALLRRLGITGGLGHLGGLCFV